MTFSNGKVLLFSASLIAISYATHSFAQQAAPVVKPAPNAAEAPSETVTLEDIVVTARRREESLQGVPVAITAITGAQLEEKGLRAAEDLRISVPGLNVSGQRRDDAGFFLRGQGPGNVATGQRNFTSVATYFAEVPTTIAGPGVFYDLANVQVLKGPQGTLFGRNTTGGAILFEPRRPTDSNEGDFKVSLGNYNYREFEGVVNVAPVPGVVALRLAGQISRRDGFTTSMITGQKLDGRDYDAFRASLLLTPSDRLENLSIVDYRDKDNSGTSSILVAINPGTVLGAVPQTSATVAALAGVPVGTVLPLRSGGTVSVACLQAALPGCPTGPYGNAIAGYQAAYNGGNFANPANGGFYLVAPTSVQLATLAQQQALGVRKNLAPKLLRLHQRDIGFTNKTTFSLTDDITLKNIVAYRTSRKNESADYDGTPLNFLAQNYVTDQKWGTGSEQLTEEFQVQGKLPSANLEYITGYYYERSEPGFLQEIPGPTLGTLTTRRAENKDTSEALFAHVEWNPSTLVGFSGGVRKTWDKRFASLSLYNAAGTCTQVTPGTTITQCPIGYNVDFSAYTYDATINLHPSSRVLVYGSYRRGYKSGGLNLPAPVAPAPLDPAAFQSFEPETVDDFELGLKADFDIGVPVRTNIAVFHDSYQNIQIGESVTFTPAGGGAPVVTTLIRNGVQAVNKGFEFETTVVPFHGVNLSGFLSYLDAHPTNSVAGTSIAGRQAGGQPKWKYGVSAVWAVPAPSQYGDVTVSANYSWQDEAFMTTTPGIYNAMPSYGLLNARVEWANVMRKGVDLAVFATNLADKEYVLGGYPITQLGFASLLYGEPRMVGVSLKVHIGG